MRELSAAEWDSFLLQFPHAHILQTTAWGELKSAFGWQPARMVAGQSGAQLLFRRLLPGLTLAYLPKGPLGADWESLWPEVDRLCRRRRAIFLKVETDLWQEQADSHWEGQPAPGFRLSPHGVQPRRTLVVDLRGAEDQILGRMKQKTRYNIRLAQKKGISICQSQDVRTFHQMMQATGVRDSFGVHTLAYYQRAYDLFAPGGQCALLFAAFDGQPLAGLMVFAQGPRAWYFYGASTEAERNRMPTYLLQWEAMRWARAKGCSSYDLWGVPDVDEAVLEAEFSNRADGLWGVYRFKRGFGGELKQASAPWDRVYHRPLYAFYRWWLDRSTPQAAPGV